jgi:hypothetical protein
MEEKKIFTFSRRSFVKNLSIAPLALSPLITAYRAEASGKVKPRLLLIGLEHGPGGRGMATGTETNFTPSAWLSPLNEIKKHVILLDGVQGTWWGNAHNVSYGHVFTGSNDPKTNKPRNASIENFLEEKLGRGSIPPMRVVVHRYHSAASGGRSISYDKNGQVQGFYSASAAYDVLMRNLSSNSQNQKKAQALLARRKQLFSDLNKDISSLRSRISSNERQRLDSFLTTLQSSAAELGLNGNAQQVNTCVPPTLKPPGYNDWKKIADKAQHNFNLAFTHLKAAFSCNLTQFGMMWITQPDWASFTWKDSSGKTRQGPPNNCTTGFHQCAAHYGTDADARLCFEGSVKYNIQQVVNFAKDLDKIKEANGRTLLENTMIVITGEVGSGNHEVNQKPVVIIGGSGAPGLRTGRYLKMPTMSFHDKGTPDAIMNGKARTVSNRTEADLLRELCSAMGAPQKTFGMPYLNRGRIPLT